MTGAWVGTELPTPYDVRRAPPRVRLGEDRRDDHSSAGDAPGRPGPEPEDRRRSRPSRTGARRRALGPLRRPRRGRRRGRHGPGPRGRGPSGAHRAARRGRGRGGRRRSPGDRGCGAAEAGPAMTPLLGRNKDRQTSSPTSGGGSTTGERTQAPSPEASGKPDSPADLKKQSWFYVLRKTMREFSADQCTDLAAALTYYAVLALFPGAIALLSLVGLFGQGPKTVDTLLQILQQVGAGSAAKTLGPTLTQLSNTPGAGLAFVLGLATAIWSASGYVGAFGRAMNRVYEIGEGRPVWKLRPVMLLVTVVTVVLAALVLMALI